MYIIHLTNNCKPLTIMLSVLFHVWQRPHAQWLLLYNFQQNVHIKPDSNLCSNVNVVTVSDQELKQVDTYLLVSVSLET